MVLRETLTYQLIFLFLLLKGEHSRGLRLREHHRKQKSPKGFHVPRPWVCTGEKVSIRSFCYNRKKWLGEFLVPGLPAACGDNVEERTQSFWEIGAVP